MLSPLKTAHSKKQASAGFKNIDRIDIIEFFTLKQLWNSNQDPNAQISLMSHSQAQPRKTSARTSF